MLDPDTIRAEFPALTRITAGRPLVYLDSAASALKVRAAIDAVAKYYRSNGANVHRGLHSLSQEASEAFEECRSHVARFIGADATRPAPRVEDAGRPRRHRVDEASLARQIGACVCHRPEPLDVPRRVIRVSSGRFDPPARLCHGRCSRPGQLEADMLARIRSSSLRRDEAECLTMPSTGGRLVAGGSGG